MLKILVLGLAISLAVGSRPLKFPKYKDALRAPKLKHLDFFSGKPEREPLIDIFPPKNYPGEVIDKTDFSKVDKALDEVMKSGDMFHDRRCALGVANEGTAKLSNPQWSITSGGTHSAPPMEVKTGQTGLNLFLKTKGSARGSVGVLTYDIEGTNHKVAISWDVPFDRNLFKVKFNMKVYTRNIGTSKDLVKHLNDDGGPFSTNQWHTRTEYGVKMRATMTDNTHAKLIVWVNADDFDPNGGYDLFTECSYHPWRVGDYCNQECYGGGWCWVDKKCDKDSDCAGRHTCDSGC